MKKVVFPGSFNPITVAHVDIVKRLLKQFDEVHILIASNDSKKGFIDQLENEQLIKQVFSNYPNVVIQNYDNLVVKYCDEKNINLIARGIRNLNDYVYEENLEMNNKKLNPEIETIFLLTNPEYRHVSSSVVRELLKFKESVEHLLPKVVDEHLKRNN